MTPDSDLLRQYADGDQEAFREIVLRHVNVIYFTALRRTGGQAQLAEEVVQDVFAALAANAGRLHNSLSLVGWLFVATRFAASKALRRERRRQRREYEVSQMQDAVIDGEAATEAWRRIRPAIDDLLDALTEQDRAAVLLRFFENRSFAEVGATFGISEDAARMRVDRALGRLARQLQRRGITSTSVLLGAAVASQGAVTAPATLTNSVALTAMSTATVGSLSAFSYFTLMSTTKMMGAAIVAVTLAVSTAIYQSFRRHDGEAALAAAIQQTQTTATQLASSNRRIADLQHEKAELEVKLTERSQKIAKLAVAPQEVSPVSTNATNPQWQKAANKMKMKFALQSYFTQRGIPAENLDEVLMLMEEPDRIAADASELAEMERRKGNWSQANDAKLTETTRQASEEAHQKLLSLVGGEEGWNSMREYLVGSFRDQGIVNRVAAAVYATDTPLNAASGQALAQVIHENRYSPGDTVGGAQVDPNDLNSASPILGQLGLGTLPLLTDAALAAAAKVLSPEQLAALRQLQGQQLAGIKIARESRVGQ